VSYKNFRRAEAMKMFETKFYTTVGYTDLPSTLDYIHNQEHHHALAGN